MMTISFKNNFIKIIINIMKKHFLDLFRINQIKINQIKFNQIKINQINTTK